MHSPLPSTIDKYQIINQIGSGHYGIVAHVLDRALHAEKAIKILDLSDPKKYMEKLEEAQILHKCSHKNIVEINEANIFNVSGQLKVILDLEYIPLGSLEKAMENRYVPISESVNHMLDVCKWQGNFPLLWKTLFPRAWKVEFPHPWKIEIPHTFADYDGFSPPLL